MKLNEFRLETFREREALQYALLKVRDGAPAWHREAIEALSARLSRTQCQPGGCQYCEE